MTVDRTALANAVWSRALLDELASAGLRELCVAPGSRSTPLVLAAAADERLRLRVHMDERSAAFFALGLGRATGVPAAVVTTSGTAAANLLPAVVEASLSDVPLMLLTADRPRRLRGADANQAIDQAGLFRDYPRAAHDLPEPSLEPADIVHVRVSAARAWADAVGGPAGPVHLNVPFDKPLQPGAGSPPPRPSDVVPEAYREGDRGGALTRVSGRRAVAEPEEIRRLSARMAGAGRGVIVAGPTADPGGVGDGVVRLATATGYPVLADPLSGARWRPHGSALVLGAYDLYLAAPEVRAQLRPDVVIRVGRAPTSQHTAAWLEEHADAFQVVVDAGARWKDHAATAALYLRADPADALGRLAEEVRATDAGAWRERWRRLEEAAASTLLRHEAFGPGHEGAVLAAVVEAAAAGDALVVGSSMPIRDLDAFGRPDDRRHPLLAYGNRGASGIDGTVSTALGVAAGTGSRVIAVLGDVAFYHDMNGLLATREEDVEAVFVVIHNDGGGIFHMLPVRDHEPHFTPYFAAPHGLDFRHAARLYGLPHARADDPGRFREALFAALEAGGCRVVEVRTDREENEARHRRVLEAVRVAALAALKEEGAE